MSPYILYKLYKGKKPLNEKGFVSGTESKWVERVQMKTDHALSELLFLSSLPEQSLQV